MPDAKDPPFTTTVEAGFSEDGIWQIVATIKWRVGVLEADNEVRGAARLELLRLIARAGGEGRTRGADRVHVHMDTSDRVSDFTLGDP